MDDGIRARGGPGSAPFGDMQANVVADMGLGGRDIDALSAAWSANMHAIEKATLAAGGFQVQMFTDGNRVATRAGCDRYFQSACKKGSLQNAGPLLWGVVHNSTMSPPEQISPDFLVNLAGFLLVRGEHGVHSFVLHALPLAQGGF